MTLGRQVAIDFYDCDEGLLNNSSFLEKTLRRAADEAGATVIQSVFHMFSPHGVSGITIIAESHMSIHTWPEYRYAAVDIFTCSEGMDNYKALVLIKESLKAGFYSVVELKRGIFPETGGGT